MASPQAALVSIARGKWTVCLFILYIGWCEGVATTIISPATDSEPKRPSREPMSADQAQNSDQLTSLVTLSYGINVDRKALITCEVITEVESADHHNSIHVRDKLSSSESKESKPWPEVSTVYLLCPQVSVSVIWFTSFENRTSVSWKTIADECSLKFPLSFALTTPECRFKRSCSSCQTGLIK